MSTQTPRRPQPTPRATAHSDAAKVLRGSLAALLLIVLAGGTPWALVHFIGSPLPDRSPSWADLEVILAAPLSPSRLIDVLAILCWLAWMTFLVDVARSIPAAVKAAGGSGPRPARSGRGGPIHAVGATLVTAIAVAILAYRSPLDASAVDSPVPRSASETEVRQPDASAGSTQRTVTVQKPRDGIYDCLWRIADRELGDGARWPEIYQLNQGQLQADGDALADPNLIQPGWVLTLPDATPGAPSEPEIPPEADRPSTPSGPTSDPPEAPEIPSSPPTYDNRTPAHELSVESPSSEPAMPARWPQLGVDLGPGAFIGIGAAAAISAALLVVHRRRRRWYEPGSGHRADIPPAPIVRTLQLARLREPTILTLPGPKTSDPRPQVLAGFAASRTEPAAEDAPHPTRLPAGVRDGQQLAVDLARSRGLGLIGPGGDNAARAMLLALLSTGAGTACVVVPEPDADRLLGRFGAPRRLPSRLRVVPNLDTALDTLEREITHRARITGTTTDPGSDLSAFVLLATPRSRAVRRLQAILDNGSTLRIVGILLDQWRPGATAHVHGDGLVTATNPGPAEQLRGARLFTLPAPATVDLLATVHDAEEPSPPPNPSKDQPAADTTNALQSAAVGPRAVKPTTASTASSSAQVHLTILGTLTLTLRKGGTSREVTATLTPRQHELLVFLALHPEGTTRDNLAESLWPDGPNHRPANALHTTLSRLRRALSTVDHEISGIVTIRGDRYQLDPDLVDVDYWHLLRAVDDSRASDTDTDRNAIDRQIVSAYQGELANGTHAEWLEVPREAIRRDAIDAAARLARALVETEPEQALPLLETARDFDPYNELIYRDIMRLQARLGRHDATSRTLALLEARLAELGDQAEPATVELAASLQHHQTPDSGRAR